MAPAPAPTLRVAVIPVTPFQQNCSVLWDPATLKGAIVDPGGDLDAVLAVVARERLTLEKILLTHAHIDHAGATAERKRRTGVPIEGPHEGDRFWIEGLPDQARRFGIQSEGAFEPDRWLADGDRVTLEAWNSKSATAPATRPDTWCSSMRRAASRSSATCCSGARSAVPTSRAAITSSS